MPETDWSERGVNEISHEKLINANKQLWNLRWFRDVIIINTDSVSGANDLIVDLCYDEWKDKQAISISAILIY